MSHRPLTTLLLFGTAAFAGAVAPSLTGIGAADDVAVQQADPSAGSHARHTPPSGHGSFDGAHVGHEEPSHGAHRDHRSYGGHHDRHQHERRHAEFTTRSSQPPSSRDARSRHACGEH